MKVNSNNVQTCWQFYENYVEEHRKKNYSNVNAEDFVSWCEDNLMECPSCGEIVLKDTIVDNIDFDGVCEDCIENGYYD